jgi:hypothetical protein
VLAAAAAAQKSGDLTTAEQLYRDAITLSPASLVTSRLVHEDALHDLGRCSIEVSATFPLLVLASIDKPHTQLMHERRCLESLPCLLLGQPHCRQLPQLVIYQRQQLLRRLRIATSGESSRRTIPNRIAIHRR